MVNITNNFQNVTSLTGILQTSNTATGGFAYIGLLIMIEIIMIMALMPFGFITSILTSGFLSLILGLFLLYLGLISWTWLMFFLGQILLIILYVTWQERN